MYAYVFAILDESFPRAPGFYGALFSLSCSMDFSP